MARELTPQEAAALGLEGTAVKTSDLENRNAAPEVHVPQAPPERGFMLRAADKVSDALPTTGALLGGALAAPEAAAAAIPTFGASSLLIPAAGAAGYSAGNSLKTLLDKATGRNVQAPSFKQSVQGAGSGALSAMNQFSGGAVLGKIGDANRYAQSVYAGLKGGPTPFAPLSSDAINELLSKYSGGPRDMVLSPPISPQAQTGARYATPRVAGATRVGAETLGNTARIATEDMDLFNKGLRAERVIPNVEQAMRGNVTPMAEASGNAIDKVAEKLPPRPDPASLGGPALPPGGNVVNQAFNHPGGQNSIIRDPEVMNALADMKHYGLQNRIYGKVMGQAHIDLANAEGAGLTPAMAAERQIDADTMGGLGKTLTSQRGGLNQGGPERGWGKVYTDIKKAIAGPQRDMLGLRGETPEASALQETPRLLEIESARRGLPGVNPQARVEAYRGMERPAMAALASPGGQALSGADFEIIRKLLAGEKR